MESYTWTIKDNTLITQIKAAKPGQIFTSPTFKLFDFTFELELYPNGGRSSQGNVRIFLYIRALSPKIYTINIKRKYVFAELDISDERMNTITQQKMYCGGWPVGTVKTADIQRLNQFTFKIDVTLFNVFDKNGEDITHKHENKVEHKTEEIVLTDDQLLNSVKLDSIIMEIEKLNQTINIMQQEMNDLKLRMEEEKKNPDDDRFDKLEKEITLIKQTMNKLSINSNINPEQQKLKSWFETKVQLPEYYDLFVENGIVDLLTASLLTMDSLKAMGIDKIGHQVKILHQIAAFKARRANNNNIPNEGSPSGYI